MAKSVQAMISVEKGEVTAEVTSAVAPVRRYKPKTLQAR